MSPREPAAGRPGTAEPEAAAVVLGVGNILYADEGVGVYVAHGLDRSFRFEPAVEIVDGATFGFELLEVFARARTLIVLDALAGDAPAGSIFRLPAEALRELRQHRRPGAHEIDPLDLHAWASLVAEPPELVLFGIVPADTDLAVGLSPAVAAAYPRVVEAVVGELEGRGVRVEAVAPLSLEAVVASLGGSA